MKAIVWMMAIPVVLLASDATRRDAFSLAGQAEPNEMVGYGVIDHLCQTKTGIHKGLSYIHYASD